MSESIIEGDYKLFQTKYNWATIQVDDKGFPILDDGFENCLLISYGTNKRSKSTDILPSEKDDKQGWWADIIDKQGRKIGSRFWLRNRRKLTPDLLEDLKKDAEDATQWMIDDSIADEINIDVTTTENLNEVLIVTQILKNGISSGYDYFYNWQNQILRREV